MKQNLNTVRPSPTVSDAMLKLSVWYLVGARGRRIKEQIPDSAGFKRLLFASIHIVVVRSIVIISRCACKCDRGMSVSRSVYVCTPDRNDLKLHSLQHCVEACFYTQRGLGVGTDIHLQRVLISSF